MAYKPRRTLYSGDQKLQTNRSPTGVGPDPPMTKQK